MREKCNASYLYDINSMNILYVHIYVCMYICIVCVRDVCLASDLKTVNSQTVKTAKKYFTFEFVRKEAVSNSVAPDNNSEKRSTGSLGYFYVRFSVADVVVD